MMNSTSRRQNDAKLLTCAEAGELLGLRVRQVREAVWRRHLPSVKIGRHVRIPLRAIEALAKSVEPRKGRL